MQNPQPLPQALPLIAYAEQLCNGARVLIVSDQALSLAEAALGRGARLVHVFERDAARRAEAQARSTTRAITFGAPEDDVRDGYFDLVLVENLAKQLPDPSTAMRSLVSLLAPRGAALIASPNPEVRRRLLGTSLGGAALDYYALYDAVSAALPHVRMLGQVPFVGFALIDFAAEGEPSPVIDTSLLPARGEEPEHFIAFGTLQPRVLEQYLVVQVPSAEVLRGAAVSAVQAPAEAPRGAAVTGVKAPAVSSPDARAAAIDVRSPEAGAPTPEARAFGAANVPTEDTNRTRLVELEKKLSRQEAWMAELEARASVADERADAAESELEELRERLAEQEEAARREREAFERERVAFRERLAEQERAALRDRQSLESEGQALRTRLGVQDQETLGARQSLQGELESVRQRLVAQEQSALTERQTAERERDAALTERQTAERERDAALTERKTAERERDAALTKRQIAERERDAALAELQTLREQIAELQKRLQETEAELAASTNDTDQETELARLEAQLQAQAKKLQKAELDLRETERVGRSLVRKLVAASAGAPLAHASSAAEVADRLVEAEAELLSLRWTLQLMTHANAAAIERTRGARS